MRSTRALLALLAFFLGLGTVPHRVCERDAGAYFEGDRERVDALAASVAAWSSRELPATTFATGSTRFDGEWLFGTAMMAAMGFGQVALESGDADAASRRRRDESLGRMETCLDAMLSPEARAFDREAWGADALASTMATPGSPDDRGHVAYLGYAGLALGLHRLLVAAQPERHARFAERHDALVAALARRFAASTTGFVETYPGEAYPVDNAAGLGALALYASAEANRSATTSARVNVGANTHAIAMARGLGALRTHGVQRETGLLAQAVSPVDAAPLDPGRGSGTALAAYFLAPADPETSAALYRAVHRQLFRTVIGFGAVLEHPNATSRADIDSGPVVLGFGVSATGFALGASRMQGDRDAFTALYATAHLFGAPFDDGSVRTYATGGPLGDAILFAMMTAPSAAALRRLTGST